MKQKEQSESDSIDAFALPKNVCLFGKKVITLTAPLSLSKNAILRPGNNIAQEMNLPRRGVFWKSSSPSNSRVESPDYLDSWIHLQK